MTHIVSVMVQATVCTARGSGFVCGEGLQLSVLSVASKPVV